MRTVLCTFSGSTSRSFSHSQRIARSESGSSKGRCQSCSTKAHLSQLTLAGTLRVAGRRLSRSFLTRPFFHTKE